MEPKFSFGKYAPPCSSRMVDGMLRGGLIGFVWSSVYALNQSFTGVVAAAEPIVGAAATAAAAGSGGGSTATATVLASTARRGYEGASASVSSRPRPLAVAAARSAASSSTSSAAAASSASASIAPAAALKGAITAASDSASVVLTTTAAAAASSNRMTFAEWTRMTRSNSFSCAAFLGVFNGISCAMEGVRRQDDWLNSFMAGLTAGTVVGLQHQKRPLGVAGVAFGAAALTSLLHAARGSAISRGA